MVFTFHCKLKHWTPVTEISAAVDTISSINGLAFNRKWDSFQRKKGQFVSKNGPLFEQKVYKHEAINGFASFPCNNNNLLMKIMKKLQLGEGREAPCSFQYFENILEKKYMKTVNLVPLYNLNLCLRNVSNISLCIFLLWYQSKSCSEFAAFRGEFHGTML